MGYTTCFLLHSQTTRLAEGASCSGRAGADGALTHSDAPFQGTWAPVPAEDTSIDHNSLADAGDSRLGLIPVRSPLLGESWLVSFPPLIDMLKFSGCSCLNSGRFLRVGLAFSGEKWRAHVQAPSFQRGGAWATTTGADWVAGPLALQPILGVSPGRARSSEPPGGESERGLRRR